jgi:hypothetical protein
MAVFAGEARCQKSLNQLPRERVSNDQPTEADHVEVIVLDTLVCRKRVMK